MALPQSDTAPTRLTLPCPDDWHAHFRDDAMLAAVAPHTATQFRRAIIMPNLTPPVTTVAAAQAYRDRILAALADGPAFTPLMTCYLTDDIDPDEVETGFREGVWVAAKLYPANATTNSAHGVSSVATIATVLARMEKIGMPLLVHGEVTHAEVDIFDREAVFLDTVMTGLLADHPGLRVVLEHITTADGVAFVRAHSDRMGGTITPHHLVLNRNDLLVGGIRPHNYCLPVAKREKHRLALRAAATSGEACFFLGTDTAPHEVGRKESACGCAGVFNAPTALQSYATVFEEEGALAHLEAFASRNGPAFYGLPVNSETVLLEKSTAADPPETIGDGAGGKVVVFGGGTDNPITGGWSVTRTDEDR